MLPGLEGENGVLEMVGVGGGDVDGVNVRVGDEFFVGAVRDHGGGELVFGDEVLGGLKGGGGTDCGDGVFDVGSAALGRVAHEVFGEDRGDPAGGC